jgi:hypothetical protein
MSKAKPAGGKSKEGTSKPPEKPFTFIPPVGFFDDSTQFTRDGWEKVTRK